MSSRLFQSEFGNDIQTVFEHDKPEMGRVNSRHGKHSTDCCMCYLRYPIVEVTIPVPTDCHMATDAMLRHIRRHNIYL